MPNLTLAFGENEERAKLIRTSATRLTILQFVTFPAPSWESWQFIVYCIFVEAVVELDIY